MGSWEQNLANLTPNLASASFISKCLGEAGDLSKIEDLNPDCGVG